ncbi:MAG TPA: GIY-YIG nuclease family protein [Methylomirabilota bacterium]|nr:GIY-YIG nuclease family protein [Methylomirabilota bacterium]
MRLFDRKFGPGFLTRVPTAPGVYQLFDDAGVLLYVGKAGNLRRRLGQYRATTRRKPDRKRRVLVRAAARITWEVCESPLAAALTEIRLIQSLRPRRNVASAFSFLYPFLGLHEDGPETYFCLTTAPAAFPAFAFHGAYRSLPVTREAVHALGRLLRFVGHPVPAHRCRRFGAARHARILGFRRLPPGAAAGWHALLRGDSREALESLSVALLEHPAATARRAEIQEDLHAVALFFDVEAGPLARARAATGYAAYPVPQAERDLLFTEVREGAAARGRSAD